MKVTCWLQQLLLTWPAICSYLSSQIFSHIRCQVLLALSVSLAVHAAGGRGDVRPLARQMLEGSCFQSAATPPAREVASQRPSTL
jgi:hypothetical protein